MHPDKTIIASMVTTIQARTQPSFSFKVYAYANINGNEQVYRLTYVGNFFLHQGPICYMKTCIQSHITFMVFNETNTMQRPYKAFAKISYKKMIENITYKRLFSLFSKHRKVYKQCQH